MTLSIQEHGKEEAKVVITYGPVFASVTEPVSHLRYFWHELGVFLDRIEKKEQEG